MLDLPSEPSDISQRQNSDDSLRLLRARSHLYAQAVRYQKVQLVGVVIVPILLGIIGVLVPWSRPYVALIALLVTVLDTAWLDRQQRRLIKLAGQVSEVFDCDLLRMPWNGFVVGAQPDASVIDRAATEWRDGDERLRDWYPTVVDTAPMHLARIACQRTNLWYDSTLRRRYGRGLLVIAAVLAGALLACGLMVRLPLLDVVLTALVPATPLLIWGLRDYFRQSDAAGAIEGLKGEAEKVYELAAAGGLSIAECEARSREFQDAIYLRRISNPLPPPWLYRLLRGGLENQMNESAAAFVSRLNRGNVSPSV
jgi:hypothetical protein